MSRILPILFNQDMVRAILDGRKTVTRRLIKPQPYGFFEANESPAYLYDFDPIRERIYPQYQMGDILYVRETWGNYSDDNPESNATYYLYRADYPNGAKSYMHSDGIHECDFPRWRPSIHMPKEAARIWLKVTDVRVERLQDITEEQARAEGCIDFHDKIGNGKFDDVLEFDLTARDAFVELWNSTLKKDSSDTWAHNPWVWVYEFERCEKLEEVTARIKEV